MIFNKPCSIVIYDDKNTTYEYVLFVLQNLLDINYNTAFCLMYTIDTNGKAFIKTECYYKSLYYKFILLMWRIQNKGYINIRCEGIANYNNVDVCQKDSNS